MVAHGADALHVAQHVRLGARQVSLVDAKRPEHFRQLVGGMRPLADQLLEIGGRNPQIAGDLVETGGVHFAHFLQLAPVLQPVTKGFNHEIDDRIRLVLNVHGAAPLGHWALTGPYANGSAPHCAVWINLLG